MKKLLLVSIAIFHFYSSNATIHVVRVWSGYLQFLNTPLTIQLGDTVQWLPLDQPSISHTITSTNIPLGAIPFNQIWQAPADTFFQYIPQVAGVYEFECTPHSPGMRGTINVIGGTTGILDERLAEITSLYPNPAFNKIYLINEKTTVSYNIYDSNGRKLSSGTAENEIDVSELQRGVYFIELLAVELRILKFVKE